MPLPRQIHPNGFDHIESESKRLEEIASKLGGKHWQEFDEDRQLQQSFLDAFRKGFSVKNAMMAVDTTYHRYQRWKATSIYFVKTFNDIIDEWHDEIYTTAAVKARGHLVKDESTNSGFVEDAEGNPIYHGVDTKMTTMFLKAMYPDEFNEKTTTKHEGNIGFTDATDSQLDAKIDAMLNQQPDRESSE